MKEEERKKGREYDQCWVVFDKDDFPDRDFNRAIGMAEAGGMRVAYSNQAFEYWFLLHYNLVQGPMHRNQYETKLSGLLGFSYNKEAGTGGRVFRELGGKQAQAITNAKAVLRRMEGIPPAQAESSTTVHLLVEELNKYIYHILSFARIILYPATTSFRFYRILCRKNTKTDGKSQRCRLFLFIYVPWTDTLKLFGVSLSIG